MGSEIIEFKDDAGMPVKFTSQDIRERLCPNATDGELALCVELCNRQHLNPFTKEVYLVKYGNAPASIITSYQVFNRRANRQQNYGGIKSGVVVLRDGEVVKKRGSAVYKQVGEQLLGGWAEVQFVDGKEPAYVELALTDYSTGKSNWAKMPGVMIEKCAKAGAWRLAYPDEFGGMYTGEEMDQKVAQDMRAGTQAVEAESVEPVADPLQPVRDLFRPFMAATGLDSAGAMAAICAAVGCASGSMHDMTLMQARRAASWMEEEIAARKAQPAPAAPEPEPAPAYEPAPDEYANDDDLLGGF
ncbi:phage recombination protein Bet [Collinsella sp. AF38-3AC]|uniref:phage recombination protein Bet n=1 Tax=Collinsella sp. AF38-3AC TaxID=2292015 RepID=UPI000E496141|nr:phage recombination protein Bet [Collinsella sp. AF38-3AC]RHL22343.1 phage recombination protein Bet [Collinsella sp. AF38-3AC]